MFQFLATYFAKIGVLGVVLNVIVADPTFINSGALGTPTGYVQVYPDGTGRGYTGRGATYNSGPDTFTAGPVETWTLLYNSDYFTTTGLSVRSQAFDVTKKNLVLIVAGQSNCTSLIPTLYVPPHTSAIDNLNIHDGLSYAITGPLLGTNYVSAQGQGNVSARLAELLVANGKYDRVILIPVCVGNTTAADWATGVERDRISVAVRRAISAGYIPDWPGITFAISWWQGETDGVTGVTSATYQANMQKVLSIAQSAGFSCVRCKFFVNVQTWASGGVSATIQGAQAAVVNGTTFFAGGNIDTLGGANRQGDNTHLSDIGAAAAAVLVYNAMVAAGI